MKPILTTLTLIIVICWQLTFAKSGPEIPAPLISHQDAYESAVKRFRARRDNINPEYAPANEYMLQSISYMKINGKWQWLVKFIHPIANDHTVSYIVTQSGTVVLYTQVTSKCMTRSSTTLATIFLPVIADRDAKEGI